MLGLILLLATWQPADTGYGKCTQDEHLHTKWSEIPLEEQKRLRYEFTPEDGDYTKIFDGKCHDNGDDHVIEPRRVLPVPKISEREHTKPKTASITYGIHLTIPAVLRDGKIVIYYKRSSFPVPLGTLIVWDDSF